MASTHRPLPLIRGFMGNRAFCHRQSSNDPFLGRGPGRELGDRGLVEDPAFGVADELPDGGEDSGRGPALGLARSALLEDGSSHGHTTTPGLMAGGRSYSGPFGCRSAYIFRMKAGAHSR